MALGTIKALGAQSASVKLRGRESTSGRVNASESISRACSTIGLGSMILVVAVVVGMEEQAEVQVQRGRAIVVVGRRVRGLGVLVDDKESNANSMPKFQSFIKIQVS